MGWNQRLRWEIIRHLAHRVAPPDPILAQMSPRQFKQYDYHVVFEITMHSKPRCWGRFAMFVVWLCRHYETDQAYQHFLDIKMSFPQYLPSFLGFVRKCTIVLLVRCLHG